MPFSLAFGIITVWLTVLGWYDCCYRRLPNVLTLGGAAVFLLMRFLSGGGSGMVNGLIGGVIGGGFLLIPFLMRGAGAGDVKLFFAVGILMGLPAVFPVMVLSTIFGLILGCFMLIAGKTDSARLKHWFLCCTNWNYDRVEGRKHLPEKTNEAVRIPFGVAIAAGTWCGLILNALAR